MIGTQSFRIWLMIEFRLARVLNRKINLRRLLRSNYLLKWKKKIHTKISKDTPEN